MFREPEIRANRPRIFDIRLVGTPQRWGCILSDLRCGQLSCIALVRPEIKAQNPLELMGGMA